MGMIDLVCLCGEVYHADEKFIGQSIKCRNCNRVLKIEVPNSSNLKLNEQFITPSVSEIPQQLHFKDRIEPSTIATIFIVFIIVVSIFIFFSIQNSNNIIVRNNEATTTANSFIRDELPLHTTSRKTIEISEVSNSSLSLGAFPLGKGIYKGHSSITVENGNSVDAFCKLVSNTNKKMYRNFSIPSNRKFKAVQIPPGEYILYVTFGSEWDTITNRNFKYNTGCSQTDKFKITETASERGIEYDNIKMTLHYVNNGNFSSYKLTAKEFEEIK